MSRTVRSDRSHISACPITSRFTAISPTRFLSRVSSSVSNQFSVEVRAALRSHRVGDPLLRPGQASRHPRQMPLVGHAQRDEIRMIDAKLAGDAMDLAFLGE